MTGRLSVSGNYTQISPHDPATGEWYFYSENKKTGQRVRCNLEQLVLEFEKMSGKQFLFRERIEDGEVDA